MKEHPILFTGAMLRAILEGRKTQTRRPIKVRKDCTLGIYKQGNGLPDLEIVAIDPGEETPVYCNIYAPFRVGDRLWVREGVWLQKHEVVYGNSCYDGEDYEHSGWECDKSPGSVWYATDGKPIGPPEYGTRWDRHPSIHMPRWASRLTLEVTGIRPERVQNITEADAIAEGARLFPDLPPDPRFRPSGPHCRWSMYEPKTDAQCLGSAAFAFGEAWNHIYGDGPIAWANNPWTWATTFKVVTP